MQFKATILILLGTALVALTSPVAVTENALANPFFEVNELGERNVCTCLCNPCSGRCKTCI